MGGTGEGLTTVRTEVDPTGLGRLTLARPERLNPLGTDTLAELVAAVAWLGERGARVVVVSGEGRAFSAGFDRRQLEAAALDPSRTFALGAEAMDAVERAPFVTIAAVRGHCVGGGLVLAAACDLRVAADDVRFAIPEVDLGLPLGWGGVPRLVRAVGPARAAELILTARPVEAAEALRLGLVNEVVPGDRLVDRADELARTVIAKPASAVDAVRDQVRAAAASLVAPDDGTDAVTAVLAEHGPAGERA